MEQKRNGAISILGNSHGTLRTVSQVDSHVKFCSGFNDLTITVCTNQVGGEQFHKLLFLEQCISEARCYKHIPNYFVSVQNES